MKELEELRRRIEEGEEQLAVVLPQLAKRVDLEPEPRRRFGVLMAAEAYLEATILLIREDLKYTGLGHIQIMIYNDGGHGYICDDHDTSARMKTPEAALCAAYIMAKIKNIS